MDPEVSDGPGWRKWVPEPLALGLEVLGADVNLLVGRQVLGQLAAQRPMAAGLLVGRALSLPNLYSYLYQHQCPHGKILMLVVQLFVTP